MPFAVMLRTGCWGLLSLSILTAIAHWPVAYGQAAEALTLDQALTLALEHNPTIQASHEEVKRSDAEYDRATGAFFPKINVSGTYTNTNRPSQAFGILLDQGRFTAADFAIPKLNNPGTLENFNSAISLNQPVYNGGRELLGLELAETEQSIAQEGLEDTRQRILFQVAASYHALALAKVALRIAEETVAIAKDNLVRIVARYRRGIAVKSDVLQARVRLAAHREDVVRARQRVAVANIRLRHAIGVDYDVDTAESLSPESPPALDRARLMQMAMAQRPDYRRLQAQLHQADLAVQKAKSAFFPNLNLQANYELNATAPFSPNGSNNYSVFGILSLNLFNGLSDAATVRKTQAQVEKVRHLLDATRRRIEVEVMEASSQVTAAAERLTVTEQAVEQADEHLRIMRNRYTSGLAPVLDLLTAELILRRAKLDRVQALYDLHVSQARLDLVTGAVSRRENS